MRWSAMRPAWVMRARFTSVLQGGHEGGVDGDGRDEQGGQRGAAGDGERGGRGAEDDDLQEGLDGGRARRVRADEGAPYSGDDEREPDAEEQPGGGAVGDGEAPGAERHQGAELEDEACGEGDGEHGRNAPSGAGR